MADDQFIGEPQQIADGRWTMTVTCSACTRSLQLKTPKASRAHAVLTMMYVIGLHQCLEPR